METVAALDISLVFLPMAEHAERSFALWEKEAKELLKVWETAAATDWGAPLQASPRSSKRRRDSSEES